MSQSPELQTGHVYFHRNIDSEDRVFAYTRYTRYSGLLVAHNLDARFVREVVCPIHHLPDVLLLRIDRVPAYDTYQFFDGSDSDRSSIALTDEGVSMKLQPLQSVVIKLVFRS